MNESLQLRAWQRKLANDDAYARAAADAAVLARYEGWLRHPWRQMSVVELVAESQRVYRARIAGIPAVLAERRRRSEERALVRAEDRVDGTMIAVCGECSEVERCEIETGEDGFGNVLEWHRCAPCLRRAADKIDAIEAARRKS